MNKKNFMKFLLKAMKKLYVVLCIIFSLSISIFTGCSSNNEHLQFQLSKKNRHNLTLFFEELLIEHGGIYTLYGHKPMTIESIYDYNEEDMKKIQGFLQNHPEIESAQVERYIDETWLDWKKISRNYEIRNYLLAEIHPSSYLEKESLLLFINLKETLLALQKYYNDFRVAYGKEFCPMKVILDLKQGKDEFWKAICDNQATMGILLGYGYNNSWLFKWKNGKKSSSDLLINCYNSKKSKKSKYYLNKKIFNLPSFAWLDAEESKSLLEKYAKERKKITKIYKKRDFLDCTLEKLCE